MKSILYVGATLMIGASIYGFVDYKNTSHKKEFSKMYEDTQKTPVVIEEKVTTTPLTETIEKKEVAAKTNKAVVSKKEDIVTTTIKHSDDDITLATKEVKLIEQPVVAIDVPAVNTVERKEVKKKKKLSTKIFSRAPIREDEDEIIETTPLKKTEVKEQ